MNNVYTKITKVRKPRVQISYEVEDGNASVKKELPFVVGVMGDFSGNPTKQLKSFKQRKFIQVNGENFNDVMSKMSPGLNLKVKNTIKGDDSEFAVNLEFKSMDDFLPDKVAEQVEPLKKLLDVRARLKELLGKADCSENLEAELEKILQNSEHIESLSKDLDITADNNNK
jgi:type VI secretion system protein ImpB